ncbi:MAG TPA: hypothetical protein VG738_07895 [Chitinophagaceae bacterium]|nr:hypothetical protein [Chitinophagaceae bacterium]
MSQEEKGRGIKAKYISVSFENYFELELYKNYRFYYQYTSTGTSEFSNGKWKRKGDTILLSSGIDSNDVPTKYHFFNTDTVKIFFARQNAYSDSNRPIYSTIVQVPVNLHGDLIPDAKIFINNDTTYCFPFFDTCVGNFTDIVRIKVDYGDKFKSRWIPVNKKAPKRLLCTAQVDFLFKNYICLYNHRLLIKENSLISIDRF